MMRSTCCSNRSPSVRVGREEEGLAGEMFVTARQAVMCLPPAFYWGITTISRVRRRGFGKRKNIRFVSSGWVGGKMPHSQGSEVRTSRLVRHGRMEGRNSNIPNQRRRAASVNMQRVQPWRIIHLPLYVCQWRLLTVLLNKKGLHPLSPLTQNIAGYAFKVETERP